MAQLTLEQLNYALEMQLLSFRNANDENYHKHSFRDWYQSKKQSYSGPALQDQLETNAIYYTEATHLTKTHLIDYLVSGKPQLVAEAVADYATYIGTILPHQQLVPSLMAFLIGSSKEKPEQASGLDYSRLRRMREKGNRQDYLKELYELCKLYRTATGFADNLFRVVLMNPDLAGSANRLNPHQVHDIVQTRIVFHASLSMGMVQVLGPDGKPFKFDDKGKPSSQKKKRWKLW